MKIVKVKGREVLDSRGYPTVEGELELEDGTVLRAITPSGKSTGSKEGLELRDKDVTRFQGKGCLKAVNNINTIIKDKLINQDIYDVDDILLELDKDKLGVNAILPISLCSFKYIMDKANKEYKITPKIMCNIINGGLHSDNNLDIQEFMIVPNSDDITKSIEMACNVFHTLSDILVRKNLSVSVGDEGGFSPDINTTIDALDLIERAITECHYIPGVDISIALDLAASTFYHNGKYKLDGKEYDTTSYIKRLIELVDTYPIISLEDPFDEDDYKSFSHLTEKIGSKVMIVGDDLFTTNTKYLEKGIKNKAGNAIIIKPNQIGTIREVEEVITLARKNDYKIIFSHRSGDSEDNLIAKLALYFNSDYVKFGSMSRSERTSKYNELMRLLEE